ncbi:MAG: TAXI family TRAP transporter solute-binding subunit [Geminicoccaceae bacterium]
MVRHLVLFVLIVAFSTLGHRDAPAWNTPSLVMTVGEPGTASAAFAAALWALAQLGPEPHRYIEIATLEAARSDDRLALLHAGQSDFAVVDQPVPVSSAERARAIMALWPDGRPSSGVEPIQLLVHADVPDEVVYRITRMIFENADFFPSAHASIRIGSERDAVVGLDLPLHPGADKYYQRQSARAEPLRGSILVVPLDAPPSLGQALEAKSVPAAGDDPDLTKQLVAVCRDLIGRGALVHFRDHRLVSDCKKLGTSALGRGRQPTM